MKHLNSHGQVPVESLLVKPQLLEGSLEDWTIHGRHVSFPLQQLKFSSEVQFPAEHCKVKYSVMYFVLYWFFQVFCTSFSEVSVQKACHLWQLCHDNNLCVASQKEHFESQVGWIKTSHKSIYHVEVKNTAPCPATLLPMRRGYDNSHQLQPCVPSAKPAPTLNNVNSPTQPSASYYSFSISAHEIMDSCCTVFETPKTHSNPLWSNSKTD
jgi:hypothetical protein